MTDDEKRDAIRRAADQNRAALDRLADAPIPPLIDRLRAAIEERLALAEAASGDTWRALRMTDVGYFVGDENGRAVARLWVEMDELTEGPQPVGGNPLDTSKHIAANDPSTVARRCTADLRILEWHSYAHECAGPDDSCMWIPDDETCPTVRAIAEGYGITEEDA